MLLARAFDVVSSAPTHRLLAGYCSDVELPSVQKIDAREDVSVCLGGGCSSIPPGSG